MPMSNSRYERRQFEKILKKMDPVKYAEWKSGVAERGKKIHQAHIENIRATREERYTALQESMIKSYKELGYSDEKIDGIIEKFIGNISEL